MGSTKNYCNDFMISKTIKGIFCPVAYKEEKGILSTGQESNADNKNSILRYLWLAIVCRFPLQI